MSARPDDAVEIMRVIDAYAYDYARHGKAAESRKAVELALLETMPSGSLYDTIKRWEKEIDGVLNSPLDVPRLLSIMAEMRLKAETLDEHLPMLELSRAEIEECTVANAKAAQP